jgi:hypothetical protein
LHRRADVAAHDATFVAQALHHVAREIRRNGEANALVSATSAENRRVDAQQAPLGIDQCAAGVAHVNGCIGLDKILVINDAHAAATNGADDPHGDRLPKAERIADRQHYVAGPRFLAVGKRNRGQIVLVDFQQRNVRAWISADLFRLEFAEIVAQAHQDFVRA